MSEKIFKIVDGDISDGYHTFGELYEHRIALFLALMKCMPDKSWYSSRHDDGSKYEGWFIAGIDLPTGTITYHLPVSYWETLEANKEIANIEPAPRWDGHTPRNVMFRLLAFARGEEK